MDPDIIHEKKTGFVARKWDRVKGMVVETTKMMMKIGKDDPRRIIHSMKVGLALTLVSLFYYFRPLYDGFGEAGMWAILTVVVVFEFTVGGTLSKSINRGAATLVAAGLGVGAEHLATLGGTKGNPIILAISVFLLAMISTFIRFIPKVRSKYDYGMMIFILTFSLVAVSGFRVGDLMQLARERLATIVIGGAACMLISISICPVWAGQDLQILLADNIEKIAAFLDGFGGEFFSLAGDGVKFSDKEDDKAFLISYKSVLNTKAVEESLATFAWWEPPHTHFRFRRQPWKQYLKIGNLARECARQIETLGEHIKSKPKVASELSMKIQEPCTRMSKESSKALKELSSTIKNMRFPSQPLEIHLQNSKAAANDLKIELENLSLHEIDLQEIMQLLVVSSTLMDIVKSIDKIYLSIFELSQKAHFRKAKSTSKDINEGKDCVITIDIHVLSDGTMETKN